MTTHKPEYRDSFGLVASVYDRLRPRYPEELVTSLLKHVHATENASVLEIAPGTGQLTEQLLQNPLTITAVELSDGMVAYLRNKAKDWNNFTLISGSFESANLPSQTYDLVVVATAFHWIDDAYKFTKPYTILRENGHLAIIHTFHFTSPIIERFCLEMKTIYEEFPEAQENVARSSVIDPSLATPDHVDQNFFTETYFKVFPATVLYSSSDYVELLSTTSEVITMTDERRSEYLNKVKNLIDTKFSGVLQKEYGFGVTIASKNSNL